MVLRLAFGNCHVPRDNPLQLLLPTKSHSKHHQPCSTHCFFWKLGKGRDCPHSEKTFSESLRHIKQEETMPSKDLPCDYTVTQLLTQHVCVTQAAQANTVPAFHFATTIDWISLSLVLCSNTSMSKRSLKIE